jgi:intron-binding protein aquarius
LFSRMIALGASQIHLNKIQCHSDIFLLWAWKYEGLVLQPGTIQNPLFQHACQFIDIPLYQGKGELEPSPHFFQNLGEAEYIVTLFLLLRLKGVRAESITVLCAYNGQRMLIEDIMRAKSNDVFGRPREITTIDQFQGMSNKVVLVSLVRTEHVGYLNDVRRWISATGSATEGLYMFGKLELFSDMSEAHYPVIEKLVQKPTKLAMNINGTSTIVEDVNHMFQIVQQEMKNEISRNGM